MATESFANAGFPGIASSTGTRVDSASKHIMACKVASDLLHMWCQGDAQVLHANKNKYCMHRDELVLNVNQALNASSVMSKQGNAYPAVITTLGDMLSGAKLLLMQLYHDSGTGRDWLSNKLKLTDHAHCTCLLYTSDAADEYADE